MSRALIVDASVAYKGCVEEEGVCSNGSSRLANPERGNSRSSATRTTSAAAADADRR